MSCDDISIDQFLYFFFTQLVITRISSRVSLQCAMFSQIKELHKDRMKSFPGMSHRKEESAKLCGCRGQRGCVGGVGQILVWVTLVAWAHEILAWVTWVAWVETLAWVALVKKQARVAWVEIWRGQRGPQVFC